MADQRAAGKKLIGAQASAELWDGVDLWLVKNPGKTVTDFVLAACLEKLEESGIDVDQENVLRDRRARMPAKISSPPNHAGIRRLVSYSKAKAASKRDEKGKSSTS